MTDNSLINSEENQSTLKRLLELFAETPFYLDQVYADVSLLFEFQRGGHVRFVFSSDGKVLENVVIDAPEESDFFEAMSANDGVQILKETAGNLVSNLEHLHNTLKEGAAAMLEMPESIENRISELRRGRSWPLLALRFCWIQCDSWPQDDPTNQQDEYETVLHRRREIPSDIETLLRYFADADPFDRWRKTCMAFGSFRDDLQAVSRMIDNFGPEESDGPCQPFTWRHNGVVIRDEMNMNAWNLVKLLFAEFPSEVAFGKLAEPVFGDHAIDVQYNKVHHLQDQANNFFRKHHLPWAVRIDGKQSARLLNETHRRLKKNPEKTMRS